MSILSKEETSGTEKHRENGEYPDVGMNCVTHLVSLPINVHTTEPQTNAYLLKGSKNESYTQQTQPSIAKLLWVSITILSQLKAPCNPGLLVSHRLSQQQQQLTLKPRVTLWGLAHISQDLGYSWHFGLSYSWEAAYSYPVTFFQLRAWEIRISTFPGIFSYQ